MENRENTFAYTYSAEDQAEIARIRSKYQPEQSDKLALLRALDRGASRKAQSWAVTLGVLGTLILGAGMSLFMTDLGAILGLQTAAAMLAGVLAGVAGLVLVALAYPLYNWALRRERDRIAPEILRLSDELLQ